MTKFWTETHASSADDKWSTPPDFYAHYNQTYKFALDAAALSTSTLVPDNWYGPDHPNPERRDAFQRNWAIDSNYNPIWLNPPYGRTIKQWVHKADTETRNGAIVVCLVPARTDTAWWHEHCAHHQIVFVRGRLKFGNHPHAAPFPSAVIIMHPH